MAKSLDRARTGYTVDTTKSGTKPKTTPDEPWRYVHKPDKAIKDQGGQGSTMPRMTSTAGWI